VLILRILLRFFRQEESKKRRCEPLSVYMRKAVLPMAAKYGVKSIFLATDDEATLAELNAYPQFTWLYVPQQERGAVKKLKWEANLRSGQMDNYAEAQAALVDLLLLAEGAIACSHVSHVLYAHRTQTLGRGSGSQRAVHWRPFWVALLLHCRRHVCGQVHVEPGPHSVQPARRR